MVNTKGIKKALSSKIDKQKFSRPEGAGNFDNMDDFNIVKSIALIEGTIQNEPTLDKHIANKFYTDSNDFWQRVGTVLSPKTACDTVTISAADTQDVFNVLASPGYRGYTVRYIGDTQPRFYNLGEVLWFGSGTAAVDTVIGREAANTLAIGTDAKPDDLKVYGTLIADAGNNAKALNLVNLNYGLRYVAAGNIEFFNDYALGQTIIKSGTGGISLNIGATEEALLTATELDLKNNNITTTATVSAEQLTSTDDLTVAGTGTIGGRLGVGTATPGSALHIKYTNRAELRIQEGDATNAYSRVRFEDSDGNALAFFETGKGSYRHTFEGGFVPADDYFAFYTNASEPLYFATANAVRLTIDATGNIKIPADSKKLYFGAGDDAYFEYTGTDFNLVTDAVGASDFNVDCGTDKTLELQETVYRDINMAGYLLTRPSSGAPDVVNFVDEAGADTAIPTYAFDIGEKVSGGFELQHDYAEGTDLVFHVHWQGIAAPTGTDNVQWRLNYILMRDGETLNAAVTIDSPDTVFDTQYETTRTDFTAITGTNFKIGDQFMFTLSRVTATGDAYAGDALIGTTGIHYQVNTIGSRQILSK